MHRAKWSWTGVSKLISPHQSFPYDVSAVFATAKESVWFNKNVNVSWVHKTYSTVIMNLLADHSSFLCIHLSNIFAGERHEHAGKRCTRLTCIPALAGTCPPPPLVCFLACLYLIIVDTVDIGRGMTTPLLTQLIQLDLKWEWRDGFI